MKMKLTICNFRRFGGEPHIFEFMRGEITLLEGTSGAGKTTILEALYWCLYGTVRDVYPNGQTCKTVVQLEQSGITIHRQKNPVRLVISYIAADGQTYTYEDAVAQNIINGLYGTNDVWASCSYISQKMRCELLSMTQNDKLEVLNKISFRGEDPRVYINQISTKNKEYSQNYAVQNQLYQEECARFTDEVTRIQPDMNYNCGDDDFERFKSECQIEQQLCESITNKMIQQAALEGEYRELLAQKEELTRNISDYCDFNEELYADLQSYSNNKSECDKLQQELTNLQLASHDKQQIQDELSVMSFDEEQYTTSLQAEGLRQDQENKCKMLGINYNQEDIDKSLQQARDILSTQEKLIALHEERRNCVSKHNELHQAWIQRKTFFIQSKHDEYALRKREHDEESARIYKEYNEQKLRHEQEYQKLLTEYNLRKTRFEQQLLQLKQDYHNRLQIHNQQNQEKLQSYANRKRAYEAEYQKIHEQYELRKRNHEEQQKKLIAEYNIRRDQRVLEYQQKQSELQLLIDEHTQLQQSPLSTIEDVNQQTQYIRDLEQSRDILSCPHCKQGVRHYNGELIPSQNPIPDLEQRLVEAKQQLEVLNNQYNVHKRLQELTTAIELKKLPSQESYLSVLGDQPIYQSFPEEIPSIASFSEAEPQLSSFNESEPVVQSYDEQPPTITYFGDPPQIKPAPIFNEDQLQFHEEEPTLSIPSEFNNLSEPMTNLSNFRQLISQLENIQYLEVIHPSSTIIRNGLQLQKKYQEALRLIEKLEPLQAIMAILQMKLQNILIDNVQSLLIRYRSALDSIGKWKDQLQIINDRLALIHIDPTLGERLVQCKENVIKYTERVDKCKIAREIYNWQQRLENKRNEVIALHKKMTNMEDLRLRALKLESNFLESTIVSINNALEQILPELFDEPITVKLDLYKETKTTKKTRVCFNLRISYRGIQYDSIKKVSGGEGDRISLALIIALNRINNSPVLLLDETISSLNIELREKCLSMLKNCIPADKAIICVSHGCVEGYYDRVIPVN